MGGEEKIITQGSVRKMEDLRATCCAFSAEKSVCRESRVEKREGFRLKYGAGYSILWTIVTVILALSQCVVSQQYHDPQAGQPPEAWNTQDYYKREHSLSKPYQGTNCY